MGALVLALLAGLVAWGTGSEAEESVAKPNLKPFKRAVQNLADAPGLRYEDTSLAGITQNTITATAGGSQFGTTSSSNGEHGRDVLRIGGKTFMRFQVDPSPDPDAEPGTKKPSEWIAGLNDGSTLLNEALARTPPPAQLAHTLSKALAELEKTPPPNLTRQQPTAVNGTPALGINTPAGRLLVTKEKPNRVLRLEPYDVTEWAQESIDQLENGETLTQVPRVTTGPLAAGDSEGMNLTPITGDAADAMFDTLVDYTKQLKNASDRGINLTLDGSPEVKCSSSGCTAVQKVTGKVSATAREERVTKGKVTAVLSATFHIKGKPAGQCTSKPSTFTLNGNSFSGTLKCSNTGAGATFASVAAKAKAEANAKSRARGGATVRYKIPYRANTLTDSRALATVEVKQLVEQAKRERNACSNSHKPSGAQVSLGGSTSSVMAVWAGGPTSTVVASPCGRGNEPEDITWGGRVRYGKLDRLGRPTTMRATLTREMMGANKTDPPTWTPPGWEAGKEYNRTHLLGAQLGGSNRDRRNFVTMYAYANSPVMRHIESQIRQAVEKGETIEYLVKPIYRGDELKPVGLKIEAHGSRGFKFTQHRSVQITSEGNGAYIANRPKQR